MLNSKCNGLVVHESPDYYGTTINHPGWGEKIEKKIWRPFSREKNLKKAFPMKKNLFPIFFPPHPRIINGRPLTLLIIAYLYWGNWGHDWKHPVSRCYFVSGTRISRVSLSNQYCLAPADQPVIRTTLLGFLCWRSINFYLNIFSSLASS